MQSTLRQKKILVLHILFALLFCLRCAQAASVSLSWNSTSDPSVAGYNIYYGTAPGDYTNEITVGNVSVITISNLTAGTTYYFAATVFDSAGDESGFSNEASFIVPGALTLVPGTKAGDPMAIKFPVAPAHWYEIQASVDLQSWTTISQTAVATANEWVQFADTNASAFPSRFYRLVLH